MEREYFDAKFEGLEKLMLVHKDNTDSHINAVSANVKRVETDLSAHKERADAHGLEASDKNTSKIVGWLGLGLAAALGVLEVFRGHGK